MMTAISDAYREGMADAFKIASGTNVHKSDCATSCAPAEVPRPCDCRPDYTLEALAAISRYAPIVKPNGPYDEMGGYCSDNYGDVISAASDEAYWQCAKVARKALAARAAS